METKLKGKSLQVLATESGFRFEWEMCNHVMECYLTGNFKKAMTLFIEMDVVAKDEFIDYFCQFYNYVPKDTEEKEGDMLPCEPQDSMYNFFVNLMN